MSGPAAGAFRAGVAEVLAGFDEGRPPAADWVLARKYGPLRVELLRCPGGSPGGSPGGHRRGPLPWAGGPWQRAEPGAEVVAEDGYAGVPLLDVEGDLLGVLALEGIGAGAQGARAVAAAEQVQVALTARRIQEAADRSEDGRPLDHEMEPVSHLGGAAYWSRLLGAEDARCRELEHPATIVLVAARARHGEGWLASGVAALRRTSRERDYLARPVPDVIALLAVECSSEGAEAATARLRSALLDEGVAPVTGTASRSPGEPLIETTARAYDLLRLARSDPGPLTI
jgi:hypothetical protein